MPQLLGSLWVLVHSPVALEPTVAQTCWPVGHDVPQAPFAQTPPPVQIGPQVPEEQTCPVAQAVPQPPQLFGSLLVSAH